MRASNFEFITKFSKIRDLRERFFFLQRNLSFDNSHFGWLSAPIATLKSDKCFANKLFLTPCDRIQIHMKWVLGFWGFWGFGVCGGCGVWVLGFGAIPKTTTNTDPKPHMWEV